MPRSEALKQLLPYLEITNGVASIGDRPYGMPRKIFAPMARKLVRLCERDGYAATAENLGGVVVSIVDKAGESFEIGVQTERQIVMPLLDDELGVFPKGSFSAAAVSGTFEFQGTGDIGADILEGCEHADVSAFRCDDGLYQASCPVCGTFGPGRKTERGAKQALLKGLKK